MGKAKLGSDQYVAAILDRRFVLRYRAPGSKRWVKLGVYPSVTEATEELLARQQRGEMGAFRAEKLKKLPRDADDRNN